MIPQKVPWFNSTMTRHSFRLRVQFELSGRGGGLNKTSSTLRLTPSPMTRRGLWNINHWRTMGYQLWWRASFVFSFWVHDCDKIRVILWLSVYFQSIYTPGALFAPSRFTWRARVQFDYGYISSRNCGTAFHESGTVRSYGVQICDLTWIGPLSSSECGTASHKYGTARQKRNSEITCRTEVRSSLKMWNSKFTSS